MSILIYKQRHRHPNQKKTPKCNYEGMRHGLFGKLEPGEVREFSTWQEAARLVRELSYRRVNMYRGIISFSPETAAELGLTDHKAWEDYMERHILTLAKYNGIRVQNLQWVAAHHNERGHPHIHVVFWDKNQRTMVPFVHPSIPDKIRRQLIRDTFAEKIQAYCEAKQRAREQLTAAAVDLVDEFEQYMERLHPSEYKRLRETFGHITECQLSMLYDADPAHVEEQRQKGIAEADKLIANKVLEAIRTMLRKDRETGSFEYAEARKAYYTERLICEILMALEQNAVNMGMEYDDCQKAMGGDLSRAAKKEWYLRHKDRGMEP